MKELGRTTPGTVVDHSDTREGFVIEVAGRTIDLMAEVSTRTQMAIITRVDCEWVDGMGRAP